MSLLRVLTRVLPSRAWTNGLQPSPDDAYLTYYDVRLTNEDVYTLKHDWVTDNIIAFWEEYLEHQFLEKLETSKIILLRPSMSFLLFNTPDPTKLRDALPDFTQASHIFLPVNDCRDVNKAEGGTHWSLLLVSVVDDRALHYDSLPPGNRPEAIALTHKISTLLNRPLRFVQLEDSPQQENGSDCGVFVCWYMSHLLLKRLLAATAKEQISMSLGDVAFDAAHERKEMYRIIERFKNKSGGKFPHLANFRVSTDR